MGENCPLLEILLDGLRHLGGFVRLSLAVISGCLLFLLLSSPPNARTSQLWSSVLFITLTLLNIQIQPTPFLHTTKHKPGSYPWNLTFSIFPKESPAGFTFRGTIRPILIHQPVVITLTGDSTSLKHSSQYKPVFLYRNWHLLYRIQVL